MDAVVPTLNERMATCGLCGKRIRNLKKAATSRREGTLPQHFHLYCAFMAEQGK